MAIEPDTKDWTWVLREPCPECGFDAADVAVAEVGPRLLADLPRWARVLERPDAAERPDDGTWSPTEYACHVRDVYRIFGERLALLLEREHPQFANWDQDETAAAADYASQRPEEVAPQLQDAGVKAAANWAAVPDDAWQRSGRRSNGSVFTVTTLGQYFLHDVVHHLHDVRG